MARDLVAAATLARDLVTFPAAHGAHSCGSAAVEERGCGKDAVVDSGGALQAVALPKQPRSGPQPIEVDTTFLEYANAKLLAEKAKITGDVKRDREERKTR